mgnify:CR=1 FL=1
MINELVLLTMMTGQRTIAVSLHSHPQFLLLHLPFRPQRRANVIVALAHNRKQVTIPSAAPATRARMRRLTRTRSSATRVFRQGSKAPIAQLPACLRHRQRPTIRFSSPLRSSTARKAQSFLATCPLLRFSKRLRRQRVILYYHMGWKMVK